jgi:hypothetical protein
MANVRLRVNLIADGKFHVRGSLLDEKLIPKHLRDADHVDYDLQNREGRVLLLRDLNFSTIPRPDSDGVPVSFPARVTAGQLFDLSRVPESYRQSLKRRVGLSHPMDVRRAGGAAKGPGRHLSARV